jgi:hypothetical protein
MPWLRGVPLPLPLPLPLFCCQETKKKKIRFIEIDLMRIGSLKPMCDSSSVCVDNSLWQVTGANAHIFGGIAWTLVPALVFRFVITPWKTNLVFGLLLVAYALPKELWYDETYETDDEAGAAWVDIVTYLSGGAVGILLSLLLYPCSERRWGKDKTCDRKPLVRRRLR